MEYASPENHEQVARLAMDMYDHICKAGLSGLPFADVAAAIAMVNGMFLAGGYTTQRDRRLAVESMGKAALFQAKRLENVPRIPYGAEPAGSA